MSVDELARSWRDADSDPVSLVGCKNLLLVPGRIHQSGHLYVQLTCPCNISRIEFDL